MGGWGDVGSHVFGITGGGISVFGDQVRWGLSFLELGWGGEEGPPLLDLGGRRAPLFGDFSSLE